MKNSKKGGILESFKDDLETSGFWQEQNKSIILSAIQLMFKKAFTSQWNIVDIVIKDKDTVLIKWRKTDAENPNYFGAILKEIEKHNPK